jgi:hypothetical protein
MFDGLLDKRRFGPLQRQYGQDMSDVTYEKDITGLVVIDPYNDFISEGGKVWDRLKGHSGFEPCPGDVVAQEHWCCSGFANTDLDLQLKRHGIHKLIVMGLIAHTCVEAPVRFAAELGYEVTMVRDATADYSDEAMHAALDINISENIPNYATAVMTADEVVQAISSLSGRAFSARPPATCTSSTGAALAGW